MPRDAQRIPRVACVVVNWNGWQDTVECLNSLRRQDYGNLEVIVVDNGSTNDSVRRIQQAHPWVTLAEAGSNLGFSAGCNAGTRLALERGAEYVWMLNNDTITPPDTMTKMVRTALSHPGAGAVGSVLYYMDNPLRVQAWGGGRVNLFTGYVSHFTAPASLSGNTYLTGASLLLPRSVCERVGLLYEGFFMYADDSDLGLRLHRAGYDLVVAEDTAILHKEGGSSPKRSPAIDRYATTSGMRLLRRHSKAPWLSIGVFLLLRTANRIVCGEWNNLVAVWQGVAIFFRERNRDFTDRI